MSRIADSHLLHLSSHLALWDWSPVPAERQPIRNSKGFFFFFSSQHTEPLSLQTAWLRMATQSKTKEMSGMREWELEKKKKKKKKACASNFRLSEKWEPDTVKADFSWSVYLFVVSNKWRQKCLHLNMKTPENPERDGESRERERERERDCFTQQSVSPGRAPDSGLKPKDPCTHGHEKHTHAICARWGEMIGLEPPPLLKKRQAVSTPPLSLLPKCGGPAVSKWNEESDAMWRYNGGWGGRVASLDRFPGWMSAHSPCCLKQLQIPS